GRRVEDADCVSLAYLPETATVGRRGRPFVQNNRSARRKRTIGDIAVPRHPTYIRGTPEHIIITHVEDPFGRDLRAQQITTGRVLDTLRFPRGTGGIKEEKRMLCVDPLGLAHGCVTLDDVVPPHVATRFHGDRLVSASVDDHPFHAGTAGRES